MMMNTKSMLEKEGIPVEEISVGSTPTVLASKHYEGITEIRPGNHNNSLLSLIYKETMFLWIEFL
jgi:D-serine deaminase-like pyridoxal phosphate-dependent protein